LDEVVVALGWVSAVVGGLALAASLLVGRRSTTAGRWRTLGFGSAAVPYVIFITYIWVGLCYALDT
jgi:hypothetical protein